MPAFILLFRISENFAGFIPNFSAKSALFKANPEDNIAFIASITLSFIAISKFFIKKFRFYVLLFRISVHLQRVSIIEARDKNSKKK